MSVGSAIRRLRLERKLTQKQVAERAGLRASYLSRIENGHVLPAPSMLARLAHAIGVDADDVFEHAGEPAVPGVRCPVSSSGECIGRLLRGDDPDAPDRGHVYRGEDLRLLRITDYLVRHGTAATRTTLRTLLDALMKSHRRD